MVNEPMEILWDQMKRPAWEKASDGAAWQQGWAYGEAWAGLMGTVARAEIRIGGERVGLAQIVSRRIFGVTWATCSRGPVWLEQVSEADRAEAYRRLRREAPLARLKAVFLTPDAAELESATLRGARLAQVMSPYSTAMLDLERSAEDLRAGMKGKWRNRLARAEESGLKIAPASAAPGRYGWLLDEEAEQARREKYRSNPPALVEAWQRAAGKRDDAMILTAKLGTETVAAMMFLRHGAGALYHIGWANMAGRAAGAHNLLLWRSISKLKAQGVKRLDLGGLDTGPGEGLARFKLGAGGELRTLCGTWF